MPLIYSELHRIANYYLRSERPDHTLQSTALVHEAYVRLAAQDLPQWQNRAHFFAVASRLMRQILVDFARSRGYQKRGGAAQQDKCGQYMVSHHEPFSTAGGIGTNQPVVL